MSDLEKLDEEIRVERQNRGLTGRLEDLIALRKRLMKEKK